MPPPQQDVESIDSILMDMLSGPEGNDQLAMLIDRTMSNSGAANPNGITSHDLDGVDCAAAYGQYGGCCRCSPSHVLVSLLVLKADFPSKTQSPAMDVARCVL